MLVLTAPCYGAVVTIVRYKVQQEREGFVEHTAMLQHIAVCNYEGMPHSGAAPVRHTHYCTVYYTMPPRSTIQRATL
jgi:hypothetical protein